MTMTIGFVGMTHLGLVTSIAASNRGHNVVCFDQDSSLIAKLNEKDLPINEPYLDKALNKNFKKFNLQVK
jgi:UDPglucose 6-dehydrogenase